MAPSNQRHPIRASAEGVELLEGEPDDLETAALTALTDEMALVRADLGCHPSDFIVRDPQEPLVLIHPTFSVPGHREASPAKALDSRVKRMGFVREKGRF
jgi:hypothetical protein